MQSTSLAGGSILVVEDEPLIALDIEQAFAKEGAVVLPARTLGDAHHLVEQNSLAAAVLDFRGGGGDADALCAKLIARKIPFVMHSGYSHTPWQGALVVPKPAHPRALIDGIAGLLSQKEIPMPKARRLIDGAAYEDDTLAILRKVFDEVWASVAPDFGDDPEEIEDARIRLATIILALAKDPQLGPIEIERMASRLIYQAAANSKMSP